MVCLHIFSVCTCMCVSVCVCVCQVARGGGALNGGELWGTERPFGKTKAEEAPLPRTTHVPINLQLGCSLPNPQMSMCLPFKRMNECSLHSAGGSGVGQVKMAGGLGDLERF